MEFKKAYRRVRRKLQTREEMSEAEFCGHFDPEDRALAKSARSAMAAFFDVSEMYLHADDCFERDFKWTFFGPQISACIALSPFPQLAGPRIFMFPESRPEDFQALLEELKKLAQKHDFPVS